MLRQLGQLRPADTNTASLFTPTISGQYKVFLIVIANTGTVSANSSVYHDADGTTYSTATAIQYGTPIPVGASIHLEFEKGITDYRAAGNIAVQSSVADTLTFTCYGEIEGEDL
jgi:hypothetical protein